jgi:hypothetical protein
LETLIQLPDVAKKEKVFKRGGKIIKRFAKSKNGMEKKDSLERFDSILLKLVSLLQ